MNLIFGSMVRAFEKNGQPFELITEINGKVVANRLKKLKDQTW